MQDIYDAIKKMKTNSSPGPDGIITEFYLNYFNILKFDLLELFETSYSDRQLAYSQYLAIIILLYKKGIREKINNWRPISLSNTDVKILTKIFAERLKQALPDIIHKNQSGSVKDRKISHNVRFIEDVLEGMDDENLILLVDQQKAFDRVEWEWLFYVLKKFNFGEYFTNWIKIIYSDMKSSILVNGYVSPYFNISRGIRQGDSLSALLYVVQAEALTECIRCSDDIKGIPVTDIEGHTHYVKGSQYVDDSNNMLFSVDYIHRCLGIIDNFGEASGSRVNKDKTVALVSEHYSDNHEICTLIDISKNCEVVLGVPLGKTQDKNLFWMKKINKMQKRIQLWKARDLTIFGKVHIIKSLVLPLIQYAAFIVDIDTHIVQLVQNLIWSYIWKWGTCFVSKFICYLPRHEGGLGIPNFSYIIKAAQVKMIIDIVKTEGDWNILAKKYLCCLDQLYGIKYFALNVNDSTDAINNCSIPVYYKKCLLAFQELNRRGLRRSPNEILWCNDKIRFKGNVLKFMHWSKSGLCYVSDVLSNGKLDKDKILHKLKNKSGFVFEFAKLNKSIPEELLENNKPDVYPSFHENYYNIPGKEKSRHIYELSTKDIYLIMLHGENYERKSEKYWKTFFRNLDINFSMLYSKLFVSKIIPRNVLDFNWRIFNGQVLTEKKLKLMKLSNGICICCHQGSEDITHLFIECLYFKDLWTKIKLILHTIIDDIDLQPFNQLFGFLLNGCKIDVVNMILSMTRWYIWKRRCVLKYETKKQTMLKTEDEFTLYLKNHLMVIMKSDQARDKLLQTILCQILKILS